MKEILMPHGKVALVDDEDFERINSIKWHSVKMNSGTRKDYFYAHHGDWIDGQAKIISMHRTIMNPPKGMVIDHINGNGLDNRKENLRIVTNRENQQNLHYTKKYSQYPGVSKQKPKCKKWLAQINLNGRIRSIGNYSSELEAATVYRVACAVLVP